MTYNVWFDDHFKEERYSVILQMMEESDADFICMQEVTAYFMTRLLACPHIRNTYFISGNHINGYGVLIASKYPSLFYESPFPTLQGRSFLICEPIDGVNNKPFAVGTVHLESGGPSGPVRIKQLKLAVEALSKVYDHVIMGDFNF